MRLAQPVLRRMLRMWLAAVCSLMNSVAPISRLLRPRATRREDLHLARRQPVGQRRAPAPRAPSARDAAEQRRHADRARRAPPPRPSSAAAARRGRRAPRAAACARTRTRVWASHVARAHAPVQLERALEVLPPRAPTRRASRRASRGSGRPRRSTRRGGRSSRSSPAQRLELGVERARPPPRRRARRTASVR